MTYYKSTIVHSKKISLLILIVFLIVAFILPLFSFDGYSILSNTTSHLGAQGSPHAWIMNLTFILLGIRSLQLTSYHPSIAMRIFGLFFGASLVLTGIFKHAPLVEGIEINQFLDTMHSLFATTTGFSFTMMAMTAFFIHDDYQRWIALVLVIIAIALPLSMINIPQIMGIAQRIMFICAFTWIFFGEISQSHSFLSLKRKSKKESTR